MARAKKVEMEEGTEEVSQEGLMDFVSEVEKDEEDIAAIKADLNERVADFCSRHGIKKKVFGAAHRQFKQFKKDRNEFNADTFIQDKLVDLMTGEKCITKISEAEFNEND
jgi:uncharacterized protein (UPF0335 family)